MIFRPQRIVYATTEQEIDAALETADQVIVEGDDRLLSYAANKAAADPAQRTITVESGQPTISVDVKPEPERFPTRSKWSRIILLSLVLPITLFGLVGAYFWMSSSAEIPNLFPDKTVAGAPLSPDSQNKSAPPLYPLPERTAPQNQPAPPLYPLPRPPPLPTNESPRPTPLPELPRLQQPAPASDTLTLVQTLVWPLVAVISILALFLIARQSIGSGRNVEITWKVTEKLQGKVVISKVQARRSGQRATA